MSLKKLHILLADDDADDCLFFKDALKGMPVVTQLATVHNGEQLMQLLHTEKTQLPDILFLDLNMPRKNGFECLKEIKQDKKLKVIPVIIFSTSYEQAVVNLLYDGGAHFFIRKPSEFSSYKKIILYTLTQIMLDNLVQPTRENFVLRKDINLIN